MHLLVDGARVCSDINVAEFGAGGFDAADDARHGNEVGKLMGLGRAGESGACGTEHMHIYLTCLKPMTACMEH